MSCARVVMHFFCQICCSVTRFFVSFLLRTIEEIFYHFCFLTLFTNIEQETHSILFSGFDLVDFSAFNRVFQTFEKPNFNKSCSLCMSKCRLVYWQLIISVLSHFLCFVLVISYLIFFIFCCVIMFRSIILTLEDLLGRCWFAVRLSHFVFGSYFFADLVSRR